MQWSNYWGGAGIVSNRLSISALDNTAMIAFIHVELLGAWSILSIKLASCSYYWGDNAPPSIVLPPPPIPTPLDPCTLECPAQNQRYTSQVWIEGMLVKPFVFACKYPHYTLPPFFVPQSWVEIIGAYISGGLFITCMAHRNKPTQILLVSFLVGECTLYSPAYTRSMGHTCVPGPWFRA